jgi:hypothetical protein
VYVCSHVNPKTLNRERCLKRGMYFIKEGSCVYVRVYVCVRVCLRMSSYMRVEMSHSECVVQKKRCMRVRMSLYVRVKVYQSECVCERER